MKKMKLFMICGLLTFVLAACSGSFLDYTPKGTISGNNLNTPENINKLIIAAYSSLGNDHWTVPFETLWGMGDVRSDNAYKGGGGQGDIPDLNKAELFTFITPVLGRIDGLWSRLYVGISRVDEALKALNEINVKKLPKKKEREAEMHFLRGHYFFKLKILFKHIPYFDASVPKDSLKFISNVEYTSQELWNKIADEFRFAAKYLPATQSQVGRPTKWAAKAYLAKTLLFSAYVQNKHNQVVSINKDKLKKVVQLVNEVVPHYSLENDMSKNYLWKFENSTKGAIWAIQRSIRDGTPNGRVDMGEGVNYPMNAEYGCCWIHIPSQNLVNAFKTNKSGLPEFNGYANTNMVDSLDFWSNTVDPRLDITVGIPGHPWKQQPTNIYEKTWARTPQIYGYYSSMKEAQRPDCPCLRKVGPFYADSKNDVVLRLDNVLLWKAEALIQLGRQNEALPIINRIRKRTRNSKSKLKYKNGHYVSNYHIGLYKPGINCTWTQDYAMKALRWERRLEFAMEGQRFFNLVRWGIADSVLNNYFKNEQKIHSFLSEGHFTKGRDEYLPIPQNQINFTHGLYKQNPGW